MATQAQLKKMEKALNSLSLIEKILVKGKGYYVYYNKPNKNKRTLKIHHSYCGQCAWGTGKISKAEAGRNGVWTGPFYTTEQAFHFINENFNHLPKVVRCSSCRP